MVPALRVLLGNLPPMTVVGMCQVLEEDDIEVIGHEHAPELLVRAAERQHPDVVILDLDHGAAQALGEQIQMAAPHTTVILWACDETVMEVLEPYSDGPCRIGLTASDGLCNELTSRSHRQRVED
jgi:DNA-binding NarL/FixJ family response regulator